MKVAYTPKPCEGDDALFKGEVVLRAPLYEERLEMASNPELMNFLNQQKKDVEEEEVKPEQIRLLIAQAKWSYQFYEKVDITRLKDKYHFKDLDSLRSDPSCTAILQDIAIKLSSGFELGNG